jgi:hypothetical protein
MGKSEVWRHFETNKKDPTFAKCLLGSEKSVQRHNLLLNLTNYN